MRLLPFFLVIVFTTLWLACKDLGNQPRPPDAVAGTMVTVTDASVTEGQTALMIVSLNQSDSSVITFHYGTHDLTAVADSDYTPVNGYDSFPAGRSVDTILVHTLTDTLTEPAEQFEFSVDSVIGASASDSLATVTILDNVPQVSFASDVRPILVSNCAIAGCHGSGYISGGMTMGAASWSEMRNASGLHGPIIVAGNAAQSNLYLKTTITPPFGVRMPAGGTPLSDTDQQRIRDWINQGANNN